MDATLKRILVLQMCRMGDILQTTPMLHGLRQAHPEAHITLVLADEFEDVPIPRPLYDRVALFPSRAIGLALRADREGWSDWLGVVKQFVADLGGPYDLVLNLTHTDAGGLIVSLVPHRQLQGGIVSPQRMRVVSGAWMTYFWSSQVYRSLGCFNLVDLYNWCAGVPSRPDNLLQIEIPASSSASVAAWLESEGLSSRPLIAVQLGASDERKRWPAERFAEAASLLPPEFGEIVLVGTEAERPLAHRALKAATRRLHDFVGRSSLTDLAALLKRCQLLLSNDTGTMHVAAAVGTRIIDLSTGPVFVHETAPYGEGHFSLEAEIACFPCAAGATCHHLSCREAITPKDVAALATHALGRGPLPHPERARVFRGQFTASGRLAYRPVWIPGDGAREHLRDALATLWEDSLRAPRAAGAPAAGEARPVGTAADFSTAIAALRSLAVEATATARASARVVRATPERYAVLGTEVTDRVRGLVVAVQIEPACGPLTAFLKTRLDSILETDLSRVAWLYARECEATADRARRLASLLTPAATWGSCSVGP
jgi:ADP-heptose:LPS heptosyltransferase